MRKKRSLWIPLALAGAVIIALGFVIDDRFGVGLATYVQAASTMVLVAVTTSYVIATFGLADTAREQLQLSREQVTVAKVGALWEQYRRLSALVIDLGHQMRLPAMVVRRGPERWERWKMRCEDQHSQLAAFALNLGLALPYLPDEVEKAALPYLQASQQQANQWQFLRSLFDDEWTNAKRADRDFSIENVERTWDEMRQGDPGDPPFEELGRSEHLKVQRTAEATFAKALEDYLRRHHRGTPPPSGQ